MARGARNDDLADDPSYRVLVLERTSGLFFSVQVIFDLPDGSQADQEVHVDLGQD